MNEREGLLIQLENEKREISWGETAPLPGFSKETLEEALLQLTQIRHKVLNQEITDLSFLGSLYPSVSFGLNSAFCNLSSPVNFKTFALSGLLQGTSHQILAKASLLKKQGYKSCKLKVKNLPLSEAIDLTKELKKDFLLRIDANCSWELKAALDFLKHFAKEDFDYFEEPLKNPLELTEFPGYIALDESLQSKHLDSLQDLANLKAFVLKPSFLGFFHANHKLIKDAKERAIDIVLSSFYESGVGILEIARLASRLNITTALGVDTYTFLKEDVLKNRIDFSKATLTNTASLPTEALVQIL
jgi:O-succinylbenzoate synthase